jgi:acyl-[acyl-carrier-protein]-phospholipid O-acyltransferase / long-chain-fatty-acid--[acyl-carrier-protein] ligase
MTSPLSLLKQRRFAPLFFVQFTGAFNDNVVRFALIYLASLSFYHGDPQAQARLNLEAVILFILPYIFSNIGARLADTCDMAKLIRWIKYAEVGIMLIAMCGFLAQSRGLLLLALFGLGCHSTLFGPAKYAYLPRHLGQEEILGGTGLIEAGTFIAILFGQLLGSIAIPHMAAGMALTLSLIGALVSRSIPATPPLRSSPHLKGALRETLGLMRVSLRSRNTALAILGISWFFAIGAVFASQLKPLVESYFHGNNSVSTALLVLNSLGIAFGSLLTNRVLGGRITMDYLPRTLLLIALASASFAYAVMSYNHANIHDQDALDFISHPTALFPLVSMVALACILGSFIVQLYALVQTQHESLTCAQEIAVNNIMNAIIMVSVAKGCEMLLAYGWGIAALFFVLSGVSGFLALFVFTRHERKA